MTLVPTDFLRASAANFSCPLPSFKVKSWPLDEPSRKKITLKNKLHFTLLGFVILANISGCSSLKDYPRYDQVLIYNQPYDYTFLRTLEALNSVPGWVIEETDEVKGVIVLRNTQYGNLFDRDKWLARFQLTRMGRRQTSVALDPSSQRIAKGGNLLKRIDDMMVMTSRVKGEKLAAAVN